MDDNEVPLLCGRAAKYLQPGAREGGGVAGADLFIAELSLLCNGHQLAAMSVNCFVFQTYQ